MRDHSKLTESGDISFYSQSTLEVAQKALGRVAKTQMVKGKMMPSPRLCKLSCNEAMFVVFPIT
jgi:hypothetical protein